MKILLNASMYTKDPTGVGIYIREVWNILSEKLETKKVEYSCFIYNKENLEKPDKLETIKLPFVLEYLLSKFNSIHRLLWNLIYLPFLAKKNDLVYSFSSHGSPFIKNQIITIHDLVCFTFPRQHRFQYLYFKYILPYIIRASRRVVVISEFTKNEVIKFYKIDPDKIIVILNGGDHLKYASSLRLSAEEKKMEEQISGKNFFLTVGASYPHKNIERLMVAVNRLPVKRTLVIIGSSNKYYNHLRRFASQRKFVDVIFMKYVSSNFLNVLYKKCVANVYISINEGFGFPPFEAAINNKISIVAHSGALPEIYNDSVYYVNPQSIADISEALTIVESSNFKQCEYIRRFPDLLNKYKWAETADKIVKLIFVS